MITDITGVILSGGKSERMGANKALLKIEDKPIIEIIYSKMASLFKNVIVISNEPELYKFLGTLIYKDIYPGKGPMSGIHSGLVNSDTSKNFFISCDLPFIKIELIKYIAMHKTEKSVTLPSENNFIQTLCGIYDKKCLPYIETRMNNNVIFETLPGKKQKRYSLINFILENKAAIVDVSSLPFYDEKMFYNLNSMDDFESIKDLIGRQSESEK